MLENLLRFRKFFPLVILGLLFTGLLAFSGFLFINNNSKEADTNNIINFNNSNPSPTPTLQMPKIELTTPPPSKILTGGTHMFQRFNNCGPASLSMALSYYEIIESQEKLGNDLRPYQIASGDNDDKSVTLEELAEKSKEYGFVPFHRPMGNPELIKYFITYDMPIIARTWTKPNEDIGHYRIIKGYDETTREIIQDDSLQNKNLRFSYEDFNVIWKKFNYEYLVLVPQDKVEVAQAILGEDVDEKVAWRKAVRNAETELSNNPNDITARFNLSVALYNVGEYERSAAEFEQVEQQLSFRVLWYQVEPIQAYYELGNYARVFEITDRVLNNYSRAFSELYIIRGNIYKNQGNIEAARAEYQKGIFYNSNLKAAKDALASI